MRVIRNRPGAASGSGWAEAGQRPRAGRYAPNGAVVAIGNFDGLHLGHLALIGRCQRLASASAAAGAAAERVGDRLAVAVVTFEPLPQAFFRPQQAPARLSTVYQKLHTLRALGVDLAWLTRFDAQFASLSARDFVERVLVADLGARHVVIGEDFRFGRGRQGDVALLRDLGAELGFEVQVEPAVHRDGERISSSGIRAHLAAAEFDAAAECLGRPFRMEGRVIHGAKLGRQLGYPTANLRIRAEPSPVAGVLAAFARVAGGTWRPAVTNLGRRPAVGGQEPLLEVHFFDFDGDLYGQRLEVQFVAKLRDERGFQRIEDLVEQMKRDEQAARAVLAAARGPDSEQ
ncbi:MAG: bifunctional riboflavin kinase/FAD synthetase [Lysobacterales bacterium]|nr:MAG: bifunctional riboflavin kinase/FAD synthetase [Xanthomonadales bacterium]